MIAMLLAFAYVGGICWLFGYLFGRQDENRQLRDAQFELAEMTRLYGQAKREQRQAGRWEWAERAGMN